MAHRHVTAISGFHRIQASPGFRAARNTSRSSWTPQAWRCGCSATGDGSPVLVEPILPRMVLPVRTLHLLAPDPRRQPGAALRLLPPRRLAHPTAASPWRANSSCHAGCKGGIRIADYEGLDVAGKVVLTKKPAGRVAASPYASSARAHPLSTAMEAGGRTELDLPDALQYTSSGAGQVEPDAWALSSPRARAFGLRARLEKGRDHCAWPRRSKQPLPGCDRKS